MLFTSLVTMPLRIIIHEAGHAVAAMAVGRRVFHVLVGRGPRLLRLRVGITDIEVNRYAYAGGLMQSFDLRSKTSRWRVATMIAAGPAANALAAGLAIWGGASFGSFDTAPAPLISAAFAGVAISQGATALFNLIPQRFGDNETVASDGMQLIRLLRPQTMMELELRRFHQANGLIRLERFDQAAELAMASATGSQIEPLLVALAMHAISKGKGDAAAIDWYLANNFDPHNMSPLTSADGPKMRAWLQGSVAWHAIKAGRSDLQQMIDDYSRRALEAWPESPQIEGTRGAWLSQRADVIGLKMLTDAVRRMPDGEERAEFCAVLAARLKREGDGARASGFEAAKARQLALASL
jgi:hypothetical protein